MSSTEIIRINSLLFLYCESALHAGVGQGVGHIDLPIQRERITEFPMLQASGLKGALRSACEIPAGVPEARRQWRELSNKPSLTNKEEHEAQELFRQFLPYDVLFGPDTDRAHVHSGALSLSDAKLLLFPVPSLVGVFAWATCPLILERFCRDLQLITGDGLSSFRTQISSLYQQNRTNKMVEEGQALVGKSCNLLRSGSKILLEEYAFSAVKNKNVEEAVHQIGTTLAEAALPSTVAAYEYWKRELPQKLVILPDEAFQVLVTLGTEVATRIAIDQEQGTVKQGALWTEEALPAESLLYAVASFGPPRAYDDNNKLLREITYMQDSREKQITDAPSLFEFFIDKCPQDCLVQLGGDGTIGRGWTRICRYPEEIKL